MSPPSLTRSTKSQFVSIIALEETEKNTKARNNSAETTFPEAAREALQASDDNKAESTTGGQKKSEN